MSEIDELRTENRRMRETVEIAQGALMELARMMNFCLEHDGVPREAIADMDDMVTAIWLALASKFPFDHKISLVKKAVSE